MITPLGNPDKATREKKEKERQKQLRKKKGKTDPKKTKISPLIPLIALAVYWMSFLVFSFSLPTSFIAVIYILSLTTSFSILVWYSTTISGPKFTPKAKPADDGFKQNEILLENDYSINFRTEYYFKKRKRKGWINVVNPFRASMVLGTPGSGKSFAVLVPAMKQMIQKGYTMYVYDYKFPDLSTIAYNALRFNQENYQDRYGKIPKFYVINFDDASRSHRCNPINPMYMEDITDCYESAVTIMLNLNKSWISKRGDFFVESPINFLTAIIGFLWKYENGKYCTFPHVIELLNLPYEKIFPMLASYTELENYANPFVNAFLNDAQAQLEGQIASAKIGLGRLSSPRMYWVMTGSDFTLDVNNPEDPKVLCVGNNPKSQQIYGSALGLYNATIVRLINKKKQLPCGVIVDELPTMYFKGLDTLIATARSNKIACFLGFQDFSQLERNYGKQEATVIINTIGNIFAGQVVGDSAKFLQDRFGKIERERKSTSKSSGGKGGSSTSKSTSTAMYDLVSQAAISNISQSYFVGSVADNFGEEIAEKIFHCKIQVDMKALKEEEDKSKDIPQIADFGGEENMQQKLKENYHQIKTDVQNIAEARLAEIRDDPKFAAFFKNQDEDIDEGETSDQESPGVENDFGI